MSKKEANYQSSFSLRLYRLFQRNSWLRYLKIAYYFIDACLLVFIKKPRGVTGNKKKIFIIYNYAFGDGVIWLQSMMNIRLLYNQEDYHITLICQNGLHHLYVNAGVFDRVIPFDLTRATFDLKMRFRLFKLLREEYYDLVLDPIGVSEFTTNVFMARALCAREKKTLKDITLPSYLPTFIAKQIYTEIFFLNKPKTSLIEYYAYFLKMLGLKDFYVGFESVYTGTVSIEVPDEYFIVFPSASTEMKKWPLERYAELIEKVYHEVGIPVLFCGTHSDAPEVNRLKELVDIPFVDIVAKTSLLEFIAVIHKAKFVITNDTSTYHIALANQVPVAIITGGYTYSRYVGYQFERMEEFKKPYIVVHQMDCFDCDNRCKILSKSDQLWPCLEKITVEDAWIVVKKLINDLKGAENEKHE